MTIIVILCTATTSLTLAHIYSKTVDPFFIRLGHLTSKMIDRLFPTQVEMKPATTIISTEKQFAPAV